MILLVLSQSQGLLWELKLHDLEYHQAGKIPSRGTTREQTRLVKCSTKIHPSKNTKPCILLTQSIWWWSWWVTGTGHWTLKGFGCSVVAVVGSGVSLSKPVSVREWTQHRGMWHTWTDSQYSVQWQWCWYAQITPCSHHHHASKCSASYSSHCSW